VAGSRPARVALDAVHLVVALGWAGAVAVAALALLPLLGDADRRAAVLPVLRAFGVAAAAGFAVLVVTGLLLAGGAVASLDALLLSGYGRILLAKIVLVGLAGLAGLRTAVLLRRMGGSGSSPAGRLSGPPAALARALRREAVVLVAVLGAAALLTAAAPALGPRFAAPARTAVSPVVSADAADLVETLTVQPNRPGRNVISVGVFDSRRPAPGPVTGVTVALRSPAGDTALRGARRAADGAWTVTVDDVRTAGRWRMTVTAVRAGVPPAVTGYDWSVADPAARPPVVSAAALGPVLDRLAGLVVLLAVGVAAGVRLRRSRRRGAGDHDVDDERDQPGDPAVTVGLACPAP
jgi:copper transport protein